MGWTRYALYWAPGGALGDAGADWLGWDLRRGRALPGRIEAPTARRYGFHATLKPPFRLREGTAEAELLARARQVAAGLKPVSLGRLTLARLGSFMALVPETAAGIGSIADAFVEGLDGFRAPPSGAELARRRAGGLSERQDHLLACWGYPHVFDEFHPHLTLSGPDAPGDVEARAVAHFRPFLDEDTRLDGVSLVGEGPDGLFRLIADLPLGHGMDPDSAASA